MLNDHVCCETMATLHVLQQPVQVLATITRTVHTWPVGGDVHPTSAVGSQWPSLGLEKAGEGVRRQMSQIHISFVTV